MSIDIRARIVAERERLGWSRSEAAGRLGISRQTYLQLESRTTDPRLSTLIRLVAVGYRLEALAPDLATDGQLVDDDG